MATSRFLRPSLAATAEPVEDEWTGTRRVGPVSDDSLVTAKQHLADAVEDLVGVLRAPTVMESIGAVDRANLAKYLTITKLRLENAIALVRSGEPREYGSPAPLEPAGGQPSHRPSPRRVHRAPPPGPPSRAGGPRRSAGR